MEVDFSSSMQLESIPFPPERLCSFRQINGIPATDQAPLCRFVFCYSLYLDLGIAGRINVESDHLYVNMCKRLGRIVAPILRGSVDSAVVNVWSRYPMLDSRASIHETALEYEKNKPGADIQSSIIYIKPLS